MVKRRPQTCLARAEPISAQGEAREASDAARRERRADWPCVQTGSALQTIISRVGEVTEAVTRIADAVSEQSIALRKVSETIGAMDRMTQQNAAMVEQTNAATKNLNHEARQLATTFAGFRIAKADRGAMGGAAPALALAPLPARPAPVILPPVRSAPRPKPQSVRETEEPDIRI